MSTTLSPSTSGPDAELAAAPLLPTDEASRLSIEAVAERVDVDLARGLTTDEVARRTAEHGANRLASTPPVPAWRRLLDQFLSPLLGILAGAAVLSLLLGEKTEAIVVLIIVVLNAVLGFIQEGRAASALASLEKMLVTTATVRRDGHDVTVDAEDLVPGDVVLLAAGDRIPADGRFVAAIGARADESSLTGESHPVDKQRDPIPGEPTEPIAVADRVSCGFMNTTLVAGRAELVVTGTGMATEMGRIAGLIASADEVDTPLQKQLDKLGFRLGIVAVAAAALVTGIRLVQGIAAGEAILDAAALAVAAIPEGLPAVVTITLAIGVTQLAKQRAIIKRLHSVETLGSTTVICSDKTGTLTVNEMTVRDIITPGRTYSVTGEGYDTAGDVVAEDGGDVTLPDVALASALCNDASVRAGEVVGDPTEAALVVLAAKLGVDVDQLRSDLPRIGEVPFDSATKYMATVHELDGQVVLFAKGAVDSLIPRSTSVLAADGSTVPLDDEAQQRVLEANERLASQGTRVLVLARRDLPMAPADGDELGDDDIQELTLVALVGMVDPPRVEAKEAVALCDRAGIAVKMITGDHPATAGAIAGELGITGRVVTGHELDQMDDDQLADEIDGIGVCARVSPEHKVRVVQALQSRGHIAAMTGDGVNDAAALQHADIGVAMGITGTEVTKEAADMVLTDDNFATIVTAVERGRTIYDNIVKFVRFQLTTNMAAIVTIVGASLVGLPAPMTALQVLFVNLIADGPPAMALGTDEPTGGTMDRAPRSPDEVILDTSRFWRIGVAAAYMGIGSILMLAVGRTITSEPVALTMTFVTFVFFQLANVFNARTERASIVRRETFTNRTLWGAVGLVALLTVLLVVWPWLGGIFSTVPLSPVQWAICLGVASTVIVAEEVRKVLDRLVRTARPTPAAPAPA